MPLFSYPLSLSQRIRLNKGLVLRNVEVTLNFHKIKADSMDNSEKMPRLTCRLQDFPKPTTLHSKKDRTHPCNPLFGLIKQPF